MNAPTRSSSKIFCPAPLKIIDRPSNSANTASGAGLNIISADDLSSTAFTNVNNSAAPCTGEFTLYRRGGNSLPGVRCCRCNRQAQGRRLRTHSSPACGAAISVQPSTSPGPARFDISIRLVMPRADRPCQLLEEKRSTSALQEGAPCDQTISIQ